MVSKVECSSVIIFLICLLKIENIRAQCTRPSVGGNRQLTADSYKDSYPDGSTAKFECSTGYVPVNSKASRSVTCSGGTWTDLELQCKKKSCGPLAEIPNGRYKYSPEGDDGILFGATATAECNQGYVLFGKARTCTVNGWSERDITCEEVKCLPPPVPANGKATEPLEDEYGYQRVITFSCNAGYFPSKSESISCLETGKFETPPECIKLPCDELTIDPNADRTGARPPYELGSLVNFQCKKGFTIVGASELTCEKSGWSSPPPQCIAHQTTTTRRPTPRTPRPTSEDRDATSPPSHNGGWKIAVGIGVPLGILALVAVVYFFKKRSPLDHFFSPSEP